MKINKKDEKLGGLDALLSELGAFGKFHVKNYFLLFFPIFLTPMYGSSYIFEAPDINYRCAVPECGHLNSSLFMNFAIPYEENAYKKCKRFAPISNEKLNETGGSCSASSFDKSKLIDCNQFVYEQTNSVVYDFDLACQDWKRTVIGTIHNAGLFVSLPLTGFLSDRYGRKMALSVACFMFGIMGLLRSFSTSYEMLVILEFLETATGAGAYTSAFVLAMELVGPKERVFGNTVIKLVYVTGLVTMGSLASYLENWRRLLRIIYTPSIVCIIYLWLLDESTRWLFSKGRTEEALAVIHKAAKINNIDLTKNLLIDLANPMITKQSNDNAMKDERIEVVQKSTFKRVLRSSILWRRLMTCSFLWITCTFVYYGLSINSVALAGNMYTNYICVVLVEIPGNLAVLMVLDRYGRKKTLVATFIMNGILCIVLSFFPKGHPRASLCLYLLGKFCITMSYSSVYIYVSEVFPTSMRQSLLGICSTVGRVGSVVAPQVPLLALYYKPLPSLLFGGMSMMSSLLVLTLPETINVPLPDTIEEAENICTKTDGLHV